MRYSFGLLSIAALALASDVHDLTTSDFKEFVGSHDLVLAECKCYALFVKSVD